jgi:PPOX class probable F420-dependent enzyme
MVSDGLRTLATGGHFATLTTLRPDGSPAAQVVWIDCDDEFVLINTELHRQKFKNVEREPRVTVCIWDKDDPYHYVEVRGEVAEVVRGGAAREHIDKLAMCYFGRPYDGDTIRSERVILRIRPDWVEEHGGQGR